MAQNFEKKATLTKAILTVVLLLLAIITITTAATYIEVEKISKVEIFFRALGIGIILGAMAGLLYLRAFLTKIEKREKQKKADSLTDTRAFEGAALHAGEWEPGPFQQ